MYASDFRRIARENLSGRWLISAAVCFIASLLGGLSSGGSADISSEDLEALGSLENVPWLLPLLNGVLIYALITAIVAFIIGGVIELGLNSYFLKQHDGQHHEFKDLFSQFSNWGGAFCLRLLTGIYLALWSLLFVIPGIIKTYSYAMAPFIMTEHTELDANECITRSRQMMDGHKFELFCLEFSFIGWAIACIFTLGIGFPFLSAYQQAARAAFYRSLSVEIPDTCLPDSEATPY